MKRSTPFASRALASGYRTRVFDGLDDAQAKGTPVRRRRSGDKPGRFTGKIQENIRKFLDDFPAIEFPGADEHDQHIHAAATSINASYLIADDKGFHKIDDDLLAYEVHRPERAPFAAGGIPTRS